MLRAFCANRGLKALRLVSSVRRLRPWLGASDLLVFMEREHYAFCEGWIDPVRQRIEVWNVPNVGPIDGAGIMNAVSPTFDLIRQRTDMLLASNPPVEPAL
jgi:hypothetical protein